MEFFHREFKTKSIAIFPLGDFHVGSSQFNESFAKQVVDEIKDNPQAYWIGMGDMMENAIIGSRSDVYTQVIPPKDQMEYVVDLLTPIKKKGLFMIAGNHEQRTVRLVGLIPEQYLSIQLGVPYKGFSCGALLQLKSKTPNSFKVYCHHNYGGGYTPGGKINRASKLRQICPTADATFSGHFHTVSQYPSTWYDLGRTKVIEHVGYDYITGSALSYRGSYAEERAKPPACMRFISVDFIGCTNGRYDNREQVYHIITPKEG